MDDVSRSIVVHWQVLEKEKERCSLKYNHLMSLVVVIIAKFKKNLKTNLTFKYSWQSSIANCSALRVRLLSVIFNFMETKNMFADVFSSPFCRE